MHHEHPEHKIKHRLIKQISPIFLVVVFLIVLAFEAYYQYKIYPVVMANEFNLTGMTKAQAEDYLTVETDKMLSEGLNFVFQGKKINIAGIATNSTASDSFEEIYTYDNKQTVNQAYDYGHTGNIFKKIKTHLDALVTIKKIPFEIKLNEPKLETILRENFQNLKKEAVDAQLSIDTSNPELSYKITEESSGYTFDYSSIVQEAKNNLANFNKQDIEMKIIKDEPQITKKDIEQLLPQIKKILHLTPVFFIYNDKKWEIPKNKLAEIIKPDKQNNVLMVGVNKNQAERFLTNIAKDVNIEAVNAKFELKNNKVSQFQSGSDGLAVNFEKTINQIQDSLINNSIRDINLIVEVVKPQTSNADVNDLGIKEIIGRGVSDFKGSPKNRIHNITTGAKTLNGLLIKPDETFSLLTALGDINAKNGYLEELVIKGNKTIPEFGGGLCQIGTTTFRVAMQSGLPIVERRNHSYNVSYYSPAGTDATIYNPAPDMKFLNDTKNYILFLTKIEGTKLIFEFWGTKDGRTIKLVGKEETNDVTKLVPKSYNIISPGAPKYVETEELEPGKKKKIESSHTGADAKFDYIITYSDGTIIEKTFQSHYIPWREVWLIGVEKKTETTPAVGGATTSKNTTPAPAVKNTTPTIPSGN